MSDFEGHTHLYLAILLFAPPFFKRISADEMEIIHRDVVFVHFLWVVAMRDKKDVAFDIFLHYKPRTATEAQSFALTNGVEPKPLVLSNLVTCFYLTHIARIFAQVCFDVITEIYVAQESYALAVLPFRIQQVCLFSDVTHFMLPKMSDGEHEFAHLQRINLAQEIRLVFHGVGRRG